MKKTLTLLVLAAFLLAACTGAEQVSESEVSATEAAAPTAEIVAEVNADAETEGQKSPPEPTPTEVEASAAADSDSGSGAETAATELVSECTVVSALPDPPAQYAELFAVQDDDWVAGPTDAAITIIEYGDFQ